MAQIKVIWRSGRYMVTFAKQGGDLLFRLVQHLGRGSGAYDIVQLILSFDFLLNRRIGHQEHVILILPRADAPSPTATMLITAPTPIAMPINDKHVRSLFLPSAFNAIRIRMIIFIKASFYFTSKTRISAF